jgi:hypothetical protein
MPEAAYVPDIWTQSELHTPETVEQSR